MIFCFISYTYIKPQGKRRQPLGTIFFMEAERSYHFGFKKYLCPLILCTIFHYDCIHVYSFGRGRQPIWAKILTPNIKALAQTFLRYLANKISIWFFKRGIILQLRTCQRKKIWVSYFSVTNAHMKFQDPSMHGLKVTEGIKKHDKQMNEQTES